MNLKRILLISIGVVILSFYYFPVTLAVLPVSNTKNLMAAIGAVLAVVEFSRKRHNFIDRDFLNITLLALLVSLAGLLSITYNSTPDYAYASYVRSFAVWSFSAYFAVHVIKWIQGKISVNIVCNYLILLCVLQCVSVLLIDTYPAFRNWTTTIIPDMSYYQGIDRMYGLGPALDVAGIRFGAVLLAIAHLLTNNKITKNVKSLTAYIIAFIFILVVGSMVGRTTSVGGGIALLYLAWYYRASIFSPSNRKYILLLLFIVVAGIFAVVYLYNNNATFYKNVRFAFEGFFNWWELGEWTTTSTERWETMIIWPDNTKTWLIGDGYFDGPTGSDPYYVGPLNTGFYKWTDVGYLRFIFYFGLLGLSLFAIYFCKVAATCASRFRVHRALFLLVLFFNFVVWFKVSTDIFIFFALFLCVTKEENTSVKKEELTY